MISGINGAHANHAKKQTKKAIQVRWNARIGGVLRLKRSMRVALSVMVVPVNDKASREAQSNDQVQGTPLSKISIQVTAVLNEIVGSPLIRP